MTRAEALQVLGLSKMAASRDELVAALNVALKKGRANFRYPPRGMNRDIIIRQQARVKEAFDLLIQAMPPQPAPAPKPRPAPVPPLPRPQPAPPRPQPIRPPGPAPRPLQMLAQVGRAVIQAANWATPHVQHYSLFMWEALINAMTLLANSLWLALGVGYRWFLRLAPAGRAGVIAGVALAGAFGCTWIWISSSESHVKVHTWPACDVHIGEILVEAPTPEIVPVNSGWTRLRCVTAVGEEYSFGLVLWPNAQYQVQVDVIEGTHEKKRIGGS